MEDTIKKNSEEDKQTLAKYQQTTLTEEQKQVLKELATVQDKYRPLREETIKLSREGQKEAARAKFFEYMSVREQFYKVTDKLLKLNEKNAEEIYKETEEDFQRSSRVSFIVLSSVLVFALLLCILLGRKMAQPLGHPGPGRGSDRHRGPDLQLGDREQG